MALTLIRGSVDPDPTPEIGRHKISFALSVTAKNREELARQSLVYRRDLTVISGKSGAGTYPADTQLPFTGSFLSLRGGVLSAVKQAEKDSRALVCRVFEVEGRETKAELRLALPIASAMLTDANEEKNLQAVSVSGDGKTVSFTLPAFSVRALLLKMK
jgi:alpha-mannosidase